MRSCKSNVLISLFALRFFLTIEMFQNHWHKILEILCLTSLALQGWPTTQPLTSSRPFTDLTIPTVGLFKWLLRFATSHCSDVSVVWERAVSCYLSPKLLVTFHHMYIHRLLNIIGFVNTRVERLLFVVLTVNNDLNRRINFSVQNRSKFQIVVEVYNLLSI